MKKHGFSAPFFAGASPAPRRWSGRSSRRRIPLIVYGSVTSVSIVQLLVAGIVPALICVALLMLTVGGAVATATSSARRALADACAKYGATFCRRCRRCWRRC